MSDLLLDARSNHPRDDTSLTPVRTVTVGQSVPISEAQRLASEAAAENGYGSYVAMSPQPYGWRVDFAHGSVLIRSTLYDVELVHGD